LDLWRTLAAIYIFQLDDRPRAARAFREALRLEPDPSERAKLEVLLRDLEG
jgi:cytochrome c-type biogenesis protein CcmH/NrfG